MATDSTMATALQRPLNCFVPVDTPYIDSYLNFLTMATATEVCPQLQK